MVTIPVLVRNLTLAVAGALLGASTVLAANAGVLADAQARYRQDMAACNKENSNQDLASAKAFLASRRHVARSWFEFSLLQAAMSCR